jgi:hypothetical protein
VLSANQTIDFEKFKQFTSNQAEYMIPYPHLLMKQAAVMTVLASFLVFAFLLKKVSFHLQGKSLMI